MMKLYSARPDTVVVTALRARPMQMGSEEFVYPPKTMDLGPGFSEWANDQDAKNALELYGRSGIVAVETGQTEHDVVYKAKRIRHRFLVDQLMNYRRTVDAQVRAGSPVPLPDPSLYAIAAEHKQLSAWVMEHDPVFAAIGGLPAETPAQSVDSALNDHLKDFGVQIAPTPVAPVSAPMGAIDIPV